MSNNFFLFFISFVTTMFLASNMQIFMIIGFFNDNVTAIIIGILTNAGVIVPAYFAFREHMKAMQIKIDDAKNVNTKESKEIEGNLSDKLEKIELEHIAETRNMIAFTERLSRQEIENIKKIEQLKSIIREKDLKINQYLYELMTLKSLVGKSKKDIEMFKTNPMIEILLNTDYNSVLLNNTMEDLSDYEIDDLIDSN